MVNFLSAPAEKRIRVVKVFHPLCAGFIFFSTRKLSVDNPQRLCYTFYMVTSCARFSASSDKAIAVPAPERIQGPAFFCRAITWLFYKVQGRAPEKNSCQNFSLALTRREVEILSFIANSSIALGKQFCSPGEWHLAQKIKALEKNILEAEQKDLT
ncbi:MAG: hypothetical protein WCX88_03030 [Patescibacteria group bacterium]